MQLLTAKTGFSCRYTHSNFFTYFKVIVQYNEKFTIPLELIASHKDKYCYFVSIYMGVGRQFRLGGHLLDQADSGLLGGHFLLPCG